MDTANQIHKQLKNTMKMWIIQFNKFTYLVISPEMKSSRQPTSFFCNVQQKKNCPQNHSSHLQQINPPERTPSRYVCLRAVWPACQNFPPESHIFATVTNQIFTTQFSPYNNPTLLVSAYIQGRNNGNAERYAMLQKLQLSTKRAFCIEENKSLLDDKILSFFFSFFTI